MVTLKTRGQEIFPTEGVSLRVQFYDTAGQPADLLTYPSVSIIAPSGDVILSPTASGVYRIDTGLYAYDYITSGNPQIGVYADLWRGTLSSGHISVKEFNFIVSTTNIPDLNSDGYIALGDDVGFNYSQTALKNINKLLKMLNARLRNIGYKAGEDQFGNDMLQRCDIFDIPTLVSFLCMGLELFNSLPYFSFFDFDNTEAMNLFGSVIVGLASCWALASQSLIERGKEYAISDGGVSLTPPGISELLNTQYQNDFNTWRDIAISIKKSLPPKPLGSGTITGNIARSPALARLRHLKERRIY